MYLYHKKTLLEKQDYIDIFDLCEELFISYSTLKKDIYKMNTSLQILKLLFLVKIINFMLEVLNKINVN